MMLLEQAKADELSKFPARGDEVRGKLINSNLYEITSAYASF
jgi:hypothetical protein